MQSYSFNNQISIKKAVDFDSFILIFTQYILLSKK